MQSITGYLKNLSSLRRAAGVALFVRTIVMIVGLALTGLLSRALDSGSLGSYWIAMSALSLVVLLAQNGVGQVTISRVSQALALGRLTEAGKIAQQSLFLVTVLGIGASLIVAFGAAAIYQTQSRNFGLYTGVFIVLGGMLCSVYMQGVDLLRAQQKLTSATVLASQPATGGLVQTSFLITALWVTSTILTAQQGTVEQVYAFFLIGWGVALGLVALMLRRTGLWVVCASENCSTTPRELGGASVPVAMSAIAVFVITQSDLWAVDYLIGRTETASYGIAATLVKYVSAVNILIGALLPGRVGALFAKQEMESLNNTLVRAARMSLLAGTVIFILFAVGGQKLLGLIVGAQHGQSVLAPLLVLAAGHLVNAVCGYSHYVLVTAERRASLVGASVCASIVTITLLALLIPHYGLVGAASASALGLATYSIIIWLECGRCLGIWCHAFAPLSKT